MKKIIVLAVIGFMSLYAEQSINGLSMKKVINGQVEDQKIQLFIYSDCYYYIKVISFLQQHNLLDKVDIIDAYVQKNKSVLKQISGRTQAPYLIDSNVDVKMPESLDIIAYFTHKFNIEMLEIDVTSI